MQAILGARVVPCLDDFMGVVGWRGFLLGCCELPPHHPVPYLLSCDVDLGVFSKPGQQLPRWHWWGDLLDALGVGGVVDLCLYWAMCDGVGFVYPDPCHVQVLAGGWVVVR